jgi:hypothetical protein
MRDFLQYPIIYNFLVRTDRCLGHDIGDEREKEMAFQKTTPTPSLMLSP